MVVRELSGLIGERLEVGVSDGVEEGGVAGYGDDLDRRAGMWGLWG